jgi:hypothetical protein
MTTAYHKQVENALVILGTEWERDRKIRHVYRGCELPLTIVDPHSKKTIKYQPDVYYILKNNKKLIFEVLDTELGKQDAIIADTIESYLVENVDALIFLHWGNESDENSIIETFTTIYKSLTTIKKVKESELPSLRKTGAYRITKQQANNSGRIRNKLTEFANDEHWFKTVG